MFKLVKCAFSIYATNRPIACINAYDCTEIHYVGIYIYIELILQATYPAAVFGMNLSKKFSTARSPWQAL